MSQLIGRDNATYIMDDDGRVWNEARTLEFNPVTFDPLWKDFDVETPSEKKQLRADRGQPEVFECQVCGKTFSKAVALAGHRRSHK